MNNYFQNLNETIKQYFNILSDEIPDFLYDYIDTFEIIVKVRWLNSIKI